MSSRFVVPGEDLPVIIPVALLAVGVASAAGAVLAWTSTASAQPAPITTVVLPPPPTTTTTNPPAATTATAPPSAAASTAELPSARPSAAPGECPALVIVFENGFAKPPPSAVKPLATFGQWLVAHPNVTVTVDGHADSNGSEDENLRLSRQRATAVAVELGKTAPGARVTVRGFGSYSPIAELSPDAADNRRVVIQTKGTECPREHEELVLP